MNGYTIGRIVNGYRPVISTEDGRQLGWIEKSETTGLWTAVILQSFPASNLVFRGFPTMRAAAAEVWIQR